MFLCVIIKMTTTTMMVITYREYPKKQITET